MYRIAIYIPLSLKAGFHKSYFVVFRRISSYFVVFRRISWYTINYDFENWPLFMKTRRRIYRISSDFIVENQKNLFPTMNYDKYDL